MNNVTDRVRRFREASRHIWNTYLFRGNNRVDISVEESFTNIEKELIKQLVFDGDCDELNWYRARAMKNLIVRIVPDDSAINVYFGDAKLGGGTKWQSPKAMTSSEIGEVAFIDFFDWHHYSLLDHEFVRGKQANSERMILLPERYCSYWLRNEES